MLEETEKDFVEKLISRSNKYSFLESDLERIIRVNFPSKSTYQRKSIQDYYFRVMNRLTNKSVHIY